MWFELVSRSRPSCVHCVCAALLILCPSRRLQTGSAFRKSYAESLSVGTICLNMTTSPTTQGRDGFGQPMYQRYASAPDISQDSCWHPCLTEKDDPFQCLSRHPGLPTASSFRGPLEMASFFFLVFPYDKPFGCSKTRPLGFLSHRFAPPALGEHRLELDSETRSAPRN